MAVKLKQLPTSSTMTTPQQTTEFTTNKPSIGISQTQSITYMVPMLLMWSMREANNHGFDPRAVATSLIAMSNLGETKALEVNLAKHDQNNMNNMNMHVAFEILDIVYIDFDACWNCNFPLCFA